MIVIKKRLPIGVSDFSKIIEEDLYFIDKSLIIKELVEDGSEVILLTRPRRFGKTLNMSMIKNFFEKTDKDKSYLFKDLKVWQHEQLRESLGKYPVIYITFKDLKDSNFDKMYEKIKEIISIEYGKHEYLVNSGTLNEAENIYYKDILLKRASDAQLETSLKNLSDYLNKFHKQKVMILLDEYDVPIQSGYLNGYYDQIIEFMRNFLSGGLKDNENLHKAVLTGILRIAKESIFSGLNNLNVCTILSEDYSSYFGFTEEEIKVLLEYYGVETKLEGIKKWYNGYVFGEDTIYNPWSIINYMKKMDEGLKAYWVNTSSNDLVKKLITKGGEGLKEELQGLMMGKTIEKYVNEDIVMNDIELDTENVWSFLFFCGYLKLVKKERLEDGELKCRLAIPNIEVRSLYRDIILSWFKTNLGMDKYRNMLNALINGDVELFTDIFSDFVMTSMSYFDVSGKAPEKVYHAFVLGMLVSLNETHEVKSNKESGYGRYDVMLIPRKNSGIGIIIEFKKVIERKNETLEMAAEKALKQIEDRHYEVEMKDRGIEDIIKLGIAFKGKEVLVKC